ncbi:sulfotransferase 1B1-like isoform X2 [Lithobates pipiens]
MNSTSSEWRRRDLVNVRGVPMICAFAHNLDEITDHFQAREDDIVIATYPKSGTTWMSEIVDLVLNDGDIEKSRRDAIFQKVPMLEFRIPGEVPPGSEKLESVPSPRVIKTHLPVPLFPKSLWDKNVKIIYVARNPKDVAVSFYHFDKMNQLHPDPGTWEEYVEKFIQGNVGFGSWGAHVRDWWNLRQQKNMLYVFYEDMLEDPSCEIRKVVKFLGKDFSEEVVDRICQHTSFKAMKENPLTNYTALSSTIMDQSISPFMRKGICGDWKNHFTVAQSERLDEQYQREMSGTDLTFRF